MMSQDQERIENQTSAGNVATLMQNAGTKVAGKIVSDGKPICALFGFQPLLLQRPNQLSTPIPWRN